METEMPSHLCTVTGHPHRFQRNGYACEDCGITQQSLDEPSGQLAALLDVIVVLVLVLAIMAGVVFLSK